ncbi:DUF1062 domain-containing protein [Mesorhizobium sp. CGMCC 1.15528]|uniref:DUF1062 domain-containing protein n=1 Tax=Mesorhizobium zhangyense TaxID=1776730 RepID=A0A7C9RAG3_9HYPH|nr:DUF1062 domain-containing protein [Mesorhizobium zhangyense]NGN42173.1 DUF1062 domain-containing protein [Mesorhizobium zhangyense]
MSALLCVQWTIISQTAPQPWLPCRRCGDIRPFSNSGKARVNANGKRIDAWLIYRCVDCDGTWNRPLLERRNVRTIDPDLLHALRTNDPEWTARLAFDLDDLRRSAERVEEFGNVEVRKSVVSGNPHCAAKMEIRLHAPSKTSLRVDRLLASELGLSRSRIQALHDKGFLTASADSQFMRRPAKDGMCIAIDLSGESDALPITKAAAGVDSG